MIARMQRKTRTLSIVGIIVALIVVGFLALYFGPTARQVRGDEAAKAVLLDFGLKLKNVSLTADGAAGIAAIEAEYGPYVTPELLADWKNNPSRAPGRLVSSPMPDRLGIASISPQATGRIVSGEVILVSSGDSVSEPVDTVPFVALLIQTEDGWKIAAYQEEKVQVLKNLPKTDEDIPGAR